MEHPQKDKRIDLSMIKVSPVMCKRSKISEESIADLADNIEKGGQIAQLLVRPAGKSGRYYELLDGYRRFLALQHLGYKTARCCVDTSKDSKASFQSASANLKREAMTGKDLRDAELKLKNYYTELFTEEKKLQEKEAAREAKRTGRDVIRGSKRGAKKTVDRMAREAVARHVKRDVKTVDRDTKHAENLCAVAERALDHGLITKAQADRLADMPIAKQKMAVPDMIQENKTAKVREEERKQEESKTSPTAVARRALEAVLIECQKQSVRVRELLHYMDGRDLDYKALRKSNMGLATDCCQLLDELVRSVEG